MEPKHKSGLKKHPQRGLGVAQLEKLRLQEESRQFRDLQRRLRIGQPQDHPPRHISPVLHLCDVGAAPIFRKDASRSISLHAHLGDVSRRWSIVNADVANCAEIDVTDEYVTVPRKRSRPHVDKLEERQLHELQTRRRMTEQADFLPGSLTTPCGSTTQNQHGTEDGETVAAGLPWVQHQPVIIKSADIYERPNHNLLVRPVVQSAVSTNVRILLASTSSSIVTNAEDELSSFQTLMNFSGAHTTNADELPRNTMNIGFCDRESCASDICAKTNCYASILDQKKHPFCSRYRDVSCMRGNLLKQFCENHTGLTNSKCIMSQEYFGVADINERKTVTISEINLTAKAESTESSSYPAYIDGQTNKQEEGTTNNRGCKSRPRQGSGIREAYTNRLKSEQLCNMFMDLATLPSTVSPLGADYEPHPQSAPAIDLTLRLAF